MVTHTSRIRCAVVGSILLAVAVGCLPSCTKDAGPPSGKLDIVEAKGLSTQEREIEQKFAKQLNENTEKAVADYRRAFGNTINADNARELSEDYAPGGIEASDQKTKDARTLWSGAVQEPASALTKLIYRRMLAEKPVGTQQPLVVFTAGGAAAGKTTSLAKLPQLQTIIASAQIVYDTTLSNDVSAAAKINDALSSGKRVHIIYIYRDPVDAFEGALQRAMSNGRTLSIEAFLDTHLKSPEAMLAIADKYTGDRQVAITVVDNSHGVGNAIAANLAFLKEVAGRYTRDALKTKLLDALEQAHTIGQSGTSAGISDSVYQAFKGHS